MSLQELKSKFFTLLKEDLEFRYAVAGLLGFEEVLKRLDRHEEQLVKLREDMLKGFARHDEILLGHGEELKKLREDMLKGFARHDEEMRRLRENLTKSFELVEKRLTSLEGDVHQIRSYVERTSLTLEEEAFEVVGGRLEKMGFKVSLQRLILPDLEVNIYGASDEVCVIGEVSTRAGVRIVAELNEKTKELIEKHPQLTRAKVIKTLYTMWVTEEAVEEAKKSGVWVLKATKELTPPILETR
ncbi:MAG: hypothetical protein QXL21_08185 [Nitrososphaerales archaeon]